MTVHSEEDTKRIYITPVIERHWAGAVVMEFPIAPGAIPPEVFKNSVARWQRKNPKKADYALFVKELPQQPIAIVEAKKFEEDDGAGLQQAMDYAEKCGAKFAYSSSGHGFIEHDFFTGKRRRIALEAFPSPEELWRRYVAAEKLSAAQKKIIAEPYAGTSSREPRYYQVRAINAVVEAFAQNKKRALLVMATGTGKTYTAFQIVSRLISSGRVRHVLFLADRNILVDQAKNGDFSAFGGKATKISARRFDPAYQIHFALYQQLIEPDSAGGFIEHFREVEPTFFDLIVIDECHRGSADADSAWHKILDYFSSAFHLGLTATPRETKDVSSIHYFGEPVYQYSLKDGISDGYLAPFDVLSCQANIDATGFSPEQANSFDKERGELVDERGNVVSNEVYSRKNFDRNIVLRDRTKFVARRIAALLRERGVFSKTIVFCVDTDHASRMRDALANELSDVVKKYPNYVMRITGDDHEGKKAVDAFCDPRRKEPTIATTSQLLSTGVDCRTCRFVVLEKTIGSMIEFKQIIGRGTRLAENLGKTHFSIIDFRGNTAKFSDPEFDGEPVSVFQEKTVPEGHDSEDAPPCVSEEPSSVDSPPMPDGSNPVNPPPPPQKFYIGENEVLVDMLSERVQFVDPFTGKLITENLISYSKKNMLGRYADMKNFLRVWNTTTDRRNLLAELSGHGVFISALREKFQKSRYGKGDDVDDFDILCHYVFDAPVKSKSERARAAKNSRFLKNYSALARRVLDVLIDKYATEGLVDFSNTEVFDTDPIREFGSPREIIRAFGGLEKFQETAEKLSEEIYA